VPQRVLYIHPGPVPPSRDWRRNALAWLGPDVEGDLLTVSWQSREENREFVPIANASLRTFRYKASLSFRFPGPLSTLWQFLYFVAAGVRLAWGRKGYDAVVSYGVLRTGFAALVVARLIRARLIIELPGHPFKAFQYYGSRLRETKIWVARTAARLLVRAADHVHLLYPDQLADLRLPRQPPTSTFADFVPVSLVPVAPAPGKPVILFLGFPWFLKGVDVLIRGFQLIAEEFPEAVLRVVGHCPDRRPFETLAAGHPRIHLEKAVPNEVALRLIADCSVFVLASRTEAAPRVVLEAMAAGRPVVASDVDGIPHYLEDETTGLLFRCGDPDDLADKLRTLLRDPALRGALGETGRSRVRERYTETAWAKNFQAMLAETLAGHRRGWRR